MAKLTVERLRDLVTYDPLTGVFTSRRTGKSLGSGSDRYIVLKLDGRQYYGHRLAWLYTKGEWPPGLLDHDDRNKKNNIFANLKLASKQVNALNRMEASSHSRTKTLGAWRQAGTKKFRSQITINGKSVHLGYFDTAEQANAAYRQAKAALIGNRVVA